MTKLQSITTAAILLCGVAAILWIAEGAVARQDRIEQESLFIRYSHVQ